LSQFELALFLLIFASGWSRRLWPENVVQPGRQTLWGRDQHAVNWVKRLRATGSVAPGKMGGHKPKAISGEHRIWLAQRINDGDFTLRGLVAELAMRGLKVDYRSVGSSSTARS
jgi:hypothetical protein